MANEKKEGFSFENFKNKLNESGINSDTIKANSDKFFKVSLQELDRQTQECPKKRIEDNILAHTGLDL